MSYLTKLPGVPDSSDVKPGMAHFEGSGPVGKSCGGCAHRGYYRKGPDRFNPRTNLIEETQARSLGCRMFLKLTHSHGPPVSKNWRACRYYEPDSCALLAQSALDRSSEGADKVEEKTMDMRQFAGSSFFTVESLRDGPREEVIASVAPGKYDKPVVTFESGKKLSLNVTNVNKLIEAYGPNDQDWIGCIVEMYVGPLKYNGGIQDGVLVNPISPPKPLAVRTPPVTKDMDDEIPF